MEHVRWEREGERLGERAQGEGRGERGDSEGREGMKKR